MRGLVLFLTGHLTSHFDAVKCLGGQQSIGLFIGDAHCNLLHQQRIPLADEHRQVFTDLLDEALKHDTLVRMTGKYDPDAVFGSVADRQ